MTASRSKISLVCAMLIFGTVGILRRFIPYPSGIVALARGLIGALFLLATRRGLHKTDRAVLRRAAPLLILSGALVGVNWICLFEAYSYTDVSVATVCYYTAPVIVLLLSPLILHERLSPRRLVCGIIALGGVFFASGVTESGFSGLRGILFAFAAAVLYASVMLLGRGVRGVDAESRTLIQLFAASAVLLPYVIIRGEFTAFVPEPVPILLLLLAGLLHTGIAYKLYFGSIAALPAKVSAVFSYIDPALALILSAAVLRERMSPMAIFGAVLMLAALVTAELTDRNAGDGNE